MAIFPIHDPVAQLAAVLLIALAVQLPLERSRVPGIVGLILAGMAIGPGALHLIPEEPVVELFGTVGLLYIMFMAGLEVDLDTVREHKREAAGFGALALALSFAAALAAGFLLGLSTAGALLLAAALASHTLVSYPMIAARGLVRRRAVVAGIGGTLVTDTAALVALVVVLGQATGDGGFAALAPIGWLAGLAAAALLIVPRLARRALSAEAHTPAERALFALAVLLLLAALAEAVGTEDILGAFLAGLCLNRALHRRPEVRDHVAFVGRMVFIPVFFVDTGMRLELAAFAEPGTWLAAGTLTGVVLGSKLAAAWIAGALFGYDRASRFLIFGMTIPQAAATLAVMTTAERAGLIDATTVDAVIVTIFATCLLGVLVTRAAADRVAGDR